MTVNFSRTLPHGGDRKVIQTIIFSYALGYTSDMVVHFILNTSTFSHSDSAAQQQTK